MRIIVFIAAIFLSACATQPIPIADAVAVPTSRVYLPAATGVTYQIRIVRDVGRQGSACPTRIYLDGKSAGDIQPGEVLTLTVPAGRRLLGSSPSPDGGRLCTAFDSVSRYRHEVEVTADANEVRNYRLATSSSGDLRLDPTAF